MEVKEFLKKLENLVEEVKEAYKAGYEEGSKVLQLRQLFGIDKAKANGKILEEQKKCQEKIAANCTHRKGGFVDLKIGVFYNGQDNNYAVVKHKFHWGDVWIRCLRCNKQWKPEDEGYAEALAFPTNNSTSSSGYDWVIINQQPIKDVARELTKGS